MNLADRIQSLRKSKGISQEELADQIGVSRQAVSKWESEQSLPDIEKIILLSDYFDVTTDYLLKGIEPLKEGENGIIDARILTSVGSAFNFMGLIVAIFIWIEKQTPIAVAVGLVLMAVGCMTYVLGQLMGKNKKSASYYFWLINIWFLSLIPISCIFNIIQGIMGRYYWTFTPLPQLGNSIVAYILCWIFYIGLCTFVDILLSQYKKR